ncbi:hypothetical protein [Azospirillum sp. ST 5-10]|uniref:hypothetical protein n=1 Tax=unclassified Azospirillum TaxID=2630922 RepID=UPI003F49C5F4
MTDEPEARDRTWTDVDPRVGREQEERRPALAVSPAAVLAEVRGKLAAVLAL